MNERTVPHPPHKEGSRRHVKFYVGCRDWRGEMHGETRCSEPHCELNVKHEPSVEAAYSDTCWDCGVSIHGPGHHGQAEYGLCKGYWVRLNEGRLRFFRNRA